MDPNMLGGQYADLQQMMLPSGAQPGGQSAPVTKPSLSMMDQLASMIASCADQIKREGDEALANELMAMQNKLVRRKLKKQNELRKASEDLLGASIMGQM